MAIVEDVQARLDSYKTGKERKRRLRELSKGPDQRPLEDVIEYAALSLGWTAQRASEWVRGKAITGEVPISINVDGERLVIPPEKFRLPH